MVLTVKPNNYGKLLKYSKVNKPLMNLVENKISVLSKEWLNEVTFSIDLKTNKDFKNALLLCNEIVGLKKIKKYPKINKIVLEFSFD